MNQLRVQEILSLCIQAQQKSDAIINLNLYRDGYVAVFIDTKNEEKYYGLYSEEDLVPATEENYYACRKHLLRLIREGKK